MGINPFMPKRFTDTEKWKDEWFMSLSKEGKLTFLFLIDNCDNAGFFETNRRVNSFLIGISETEYLGAIEGLKRGLITSKDGNKHFIKKFLFHQKNTPLNLENNAHKQIIGLIRSNLELFDFDFNKLGACEGLFSPIGKGKGNSKGLGTDKGNGIDSEEIKKTFETFWNLYAKKVDRESCEKKWSVLKQEERDLIIINVPLYVKSTPDKQYRRNPETYLNNNGWLDEIIFKTEQNGNNQNSGSTGIIPKNKDFGNI